MGNFLKDKYDLWNVTYINVWCLQLMTFHLMYIYIHVRKVTKVCSDGRAVCSIISQVKCLTPILAWNFFTYMHTYIHGTSVFSFVQTIYWKSFKCFRTKLKLLHKFAYVKLTLKYLHSCNTTFLQNKFKNQGSTPLITGVKKVSGFKSCQWSISSSWLWRSAVLWIIVTDYSLIL